MVERREEWARLERTSAFAELMRSRRAFLIPATIFFLIFYFGLPVLQVSTTVLAAKVIGSISLAYVYGFAQFVMTLVVMHLYIRWSNKWDRMIDEARQEAAEGETEGERTETT